jgi:hypothetical protein
LQQLRAIRGYPAAGLPQNLARCVACDQFSVGKPNLRREIRTFKVHMRRVLIVKKNIKILKLPNRLISGIRTFAMYS